MRLLRPTVPALATLMLCSLSVAAEPAPIRMAFNIPPQPLSDALVEWSRQSGLQVLQRETDTAAAELVSAKVSGEYSPAEALAKMLVKTQLKYEFVNERTVRLARTEGEGKKANIAEGNESTVTIMSPSPSQGGGGGEVTPGKEKNEAQSQDVIELEEIVVVTGTHIRGVAPTGSPVVVFTRSDINKSGAATVGEFLRKIPQNFSLTDQETVQNNGNSKSSDVNVSHGSAVNLRGLGAGATLTLLNGQRLAPSGNAGGFVDVSLIPLSALERIEILTDGASAIYGADAVGGVVNFVLRRDFNGGETSVRYGDSTQGGGAEVMASQLIGVSWDQGNAMLVYEHMDEDSVDVTDRDFIPPISSLTPGPFSLFPEQRRNSVLVTARQALTPGLEISTRGLFSKRHFVEDIAAFSGLAHTEGDAQIAGGTLGLDASLSDTWNLTTVADYSQTKQEASSRSTPGVPIEQSIKAASSGVDARLSGALFEFNGAATRASIGASVRREEFDQATALAGELKRNVKSAYAELFVPLIGPSSDSWAHRLELSVAGRYDDYDDFGSSGLRPKIGVAWYPTPDFGLRASWSESFRAPLLQQMDTSSTAAIRYFLFNLPDPASQTGFTPTIFTIVPGNPTLGPETSTSVTAGIDVTPQALPDFRMSITYYETEYDNRVSTPPLSGSIFLLHQQAAQLAPFIHRSPDPAVVAGFFAQGVLNSLGIPPTGVRAIYDARFQNIASLDTSGVEFSVSNSFASDVGSFTPFLGANYIVSLDARAAATTPESVLFDRIYTPARLRARGGLWWSLASIATGLSANYVNEYANNTTTPAADIDSWLTFDWHVGYEASQSVTPILRGLSVDLYVQNLTDEDPPKVVVPPSLQTFDFGYDATNSSSMGRFISLQVSKRW